MGSIPPPATHTASPPLMSQQTTAESKELRKGNTEIKTAANVFADILIPIDIWSSSSPSSPYMSIFLSRTVLLSRVLCNTVECSQSSCIGKAWNQWYCSKRITVTPLLQCAIQEPKDQKGAILTGPGAYQAQDFMSSYSLESWQG